MKRSMKSQNLPDIDAIRMTYLMYYVAWIYVLDSIPCLDTCACGDNGRRRYTTHVILNLILLISRDAIHMVVCRYTHRSVVLLQADDLTRLPIREIAGITRHIALILGGLNKPIPPRVPRLAITLSSSESVARSCNSLIRGLL